MTVVVKAQSEPLPEEMWAAGKRAEAFEEMYRRWYPALVNLCRRNLGGNGDPEAVAQETFVRAWASLDRFAPTRPFWPWVATIARRLCIDHRRRLGREQWSVHVELTAGDAERPVDEFVEADEECRSARLALERLKPSERRVITLADVRGWSYDEIARFEGVTIESIRGSLKRARASLRKSYQKVATGGLAVACTRPWRGIRARLGRLVELAHRNAASASAISAGDAVLGILAAALLVAGPTTIVHPARGFTTAERPIGDPTENRPAAAVVGTTAVSAPSAPPSSGLGAPMGTQAATVGPSGPSDNGFGGLPLLPPDGATAPEDVSFAEIVVSPSYERDGTLFAAGTVTKQCPYGPCAVLFRSVDRGAGWHRLPAVGFTGGRVLLPPRFPDDPRIFVSGAAALLVSEDGGTTFTAVAPVGGPAAISPTFADDHRVLLGQAPGWEYRDDVEAMRPSGIVMSSTSLFASPAFSPAYAEDRTIFIGGAGVDGQGRQHSAVFRCNSSVCGTASPLSGSVGTPELAVSPRFASDGVVVAWRGTALYRSTDRGVSFEPMSLPIEGTVQDVAFEPSGTLLVAVRQLSANGPSGGVLRSADGGRTWGLLGAGTRLASGVATLAVTADGHILAAVSAAAGGGLLCSRDLGITWEARCA